MSQILDLSYQSQGVAPDIRRQTIAPENKVPQSSLTIGKSFCPQPYTHNRNGQKPPDPLPEKDSVSFQFV